MKIILILSNLQARETEIVWKMGKIKKRIGVFDFLWSAQKWAEKPIVQGWENKRNTYFFGYSKIGSLGKNEW